MSDFPRFSLLQLPTPLHRLDHLSARYGADIWIKRDDLTGFGGGGNKGRKLEYLIADAKQQGTDVIVSCGSLQSNFVRQLGVACSVAGLKCAAATMALPYDSEAGVPNFEGLNPEGGNVLLGEMAGTDLRVFPNDDWLVLYAHQEAIAQEYEARGLKVYRIAIGGSSALGVYGFYRAAEELKAQSPEPFDYLVVGTSSGSTQTGLTYGFHKSATKVIGVSADPEPEIANEFAETGRSFAKLLGIPAIGAEDFNMNFDWVGPGYATWSEAGNAATLELWQTEGILLDPVYSAKAFAYLLFALREKLLSGRIVFWHTGGIPSLFALPAKALRQPALSY